MTINPEQIRAARAMLKWTQSELADRVKASVNSIKNIEAEATQARPAMLDKIKHAFDTAGIEFLPRSGVREADNLIRVLDEENPFLTVFEDVLRTFPNGKGEVLYSGADERRAPQEEIDVLRKISQKGIIQKSLIKEGITYYFGKREEYRWLKEQYISPDVTIIYADKVAYGLTPISDYPNKYIPGKLLLIKNQLIADDYRKKFNFMWDNSPTPPQSTSPIRF